MTNSEVNPLRQLRLVTERLSRDGTVKERSNGAIHNVFPISIDRAQGEALREWVVKEKAVHTIEVGLAWGISALHVCEGLLMNGDANAHHVAIDPFQSSRPMFADCGLQVLREAGLASTVEHVAEKSQIALPRFLSEGRRFDFAYVDGSHLFDAVFLDLVYLGQLVRTGGVIFGDDYQAPAVARAVSFCLTNLSWKLEDLGQSESHQWYVLRTALDPVPRSYPHFNDF
jgi:predicted O-methyltransferase YrrM